MLLQLLVLSCIASLTLSSTPASLPGPWLEILEWVNRDSENCPNLGATNGTGQKSLSSGDSGFAYDTNNVTYRKRDFLALFDLSDATQIASDCIYLANYGINSFNSNIVSKTNWSVGISYNATTVTIRDYDSPTCGGAPQNQFTRELNKCIFDGSEAGRNVSRWFRFTPNLPTGYSPIGQGPAANIQLDFYVASVPACSVFDPFARKTIPNDQQCHLVHGSVYLNGYCNKDKLFTGCISNNSQCTSCVAFTARTTPACYSDANLFAYGGLVTDVYITCGAGALSATLFALVALLVLFF